VTGTILDTILATKRDEVAAGKRERTLGELEAVARAAGPTRGFAAALRRTPGSAPRVIAEIKRASPSAGAIRAGADPAEVARAYAANGAAALSVLTDRRYFDGELAFLAAARAACALPLLRKDFVVDPYQVVEARAAGADAVLLIVAALPPGLLAELIAVAVAHQLDALVEVHDLAEAEVAVRAGATVIGVNHRDLRTFAMDMSLTRTIAPHLPAGAIVVAESGIRTGADAAGLACDALLVGESLMRASDPGAALHALIASLR
jgi:indole-3-glycerol phosphate synthase